MRTCTVVSPSRSRVLARASFWGEKKRRAHCAATETRLSEFALTQRKSLSFPKVSDLDTLESVLDSPHETCFLVRALAFRDSTPVYGLFFLSFLLQNSQGPEFVRRSRCAGARKCASVRKGRILVYEVSRFQSPSDEGTRSSVVSRAAARPRRRLNHRGEVLLLSR